jgi:hypothetical protein
MIGRDPVRQGVRRPLAKIEHVLTETQKNPEIRGDSPSGG